VVTSSRRLQRHRYLVESILPQLEKLRVAALTFEQGLIDELRTVPIDQMASVRNLIHYLALRQFDLAGLQQDLGLLGLSRLGRMEASVLSSLEAVLDAAHALAGLSRRLHDAPPPVDLSNGPLYLREHADALLGKPLPNVDTRIMVTMPSEAADDPTIVENLLAQGMQIMRINCAHDHLQVWLKMIEHLRTAEVKLNRRCRIYADLAGPKIRTGKLPVLGRLVEIKVRRDWQGCLLAPTRIQLTPAGVDRILGESELPLPPELLARIRQGDELRLTDTRGHLRRVRVDRVTPKEVSGLSEQHAYLAEGSRVELYRNRRRIVRSELRDLPERVEPLRLKVGDTLILVPEGQPARHASEKHAAQISCAPIELFNALKENDPVWLDDGKIGGRVQIIKKRSIVLRITHASVEGSKLGEAKGINLPESVLPLSALQHEDREHLHQLAPHIDLVGLSFVQSPGDVDVLYAELESISAQELGVILKIETRPACEQLPAILLTAMRRRRVGVMVARGDLAVEIGFERLATMQEEILNLCAAAHIPVIWATQVLETMAKSGIPSRAEVSDAALGIRAECVMLNKGPYIVETVKFLCEVLERAGEYRRNHRPISPKFEWSGLRREGFAEVKQ